MSGMEHDLALLEAAQKSEQSSTIDVIMDLYCGSDNSVTSKFKCTIADIDCIYRRLKILLQNKNYSRNFKSRQ